jgi:hypothetical protein
MIVNSAMFLWLSPSLGLRPVAMAFRDGRHRGGLCTRQGPSHAREPQGRAFLQRSGREGAPRGRGKKLDLGLRAAPAPIGKPPCNRERSSCVNKVDCRPSDPSSLVHLVRTEAPGAVRSGRRQVWL